MAERKLTPMIRYNLRERGRTYRGKPRNFNIPKLVACINGPVTQEKVRCHDAAGYFGHWPRIKFGMNPSEGGIVDGVAVAVEPAIKIVHLKAFDDGTVEHQCEFLDTASGRLAWRLFNSKMGGFSSAIDERAPEFFGFDYVLEPNFATNRGFALDSALDEDETPEVEATLDAVEAVAQYNGQIAMIEKMLDAVSSERDELQRIVGRLQVENEDLLSMLARGGKTLDDLIADSTRTGMPLLLPKGLAEKMANDAVKFKEMALIVPVREEVGDGKGKVDENLVGKFRG